MIILKTRHNGGYIVTCLDGLPPGGDASQQPQVNALPVPLLFMGRELQSATV
jgi:hypothetical protein